ncbi:hypothetical protein [Acinetobacter sp.]|jgi:hypothetical protein|uniref:hypothetical protein n=1 Tax=Acinetobacter sp. TaxID=472 RepID=UPI0028231F38|nr:hypothetical protein [Acinetobacter sp.]MDR2249015.1 hypothetical protein [Acinetobacter sp.]
MVAANKEFPWMSYYGNYKFFLSRLKNHDKVLRIEPIEAKNGIYKIHLSNRILNIFICECYCFGVAEYYELLDKVDAKIDAIVINSNWCGYTSEVKELCKEFNVGVFEFGEFFGAINRKDFWNYISPE